jgi:hypothetical protein
MRSEWLVLSVMVLGCDGNSTGPPDYALAAGTYSLTAINQKRLPDTVVSGADTKVFSAGNLTLEGGGFFHRYSQHLIFQQLPQSGALQQYSEIVENGIYVLAGSSNSTNPSGPPGTTITFVPDNGATHSGTLENPQITSASANLALNFSRVCDVCFGFATKSWPSMSSRGHALMLY